MEKTTRRNLFFVAAGGVTAVVGLVMKPETQAQTQGALPLDTEHRHDHSVGPISGPLAQATVSFGQFPADSTVDRMQATNLASRNVHQLIPSEVTIRAGGTVNFVVAGFHQIVIYDNGTQPDNIDTNRVLPAPLQLLIDDPRGRIYRGLAPAIVPANFFGPGVPPTDIARPPGDRVESVNFPSPGVYLVICSVLPHFEDGMFGYVRVVP